MYTDVLSRSSIAITERKEAEHVPHEIANAMKMPGDNLTCNTWMLFSLMLHSTIAVHLLLPFPVFEITVIVIQMDELTVLVVR